MNTTFNFSKYPPQNSGKVPVTKYMAETLHLGTQLGVCVSSEAIQKKIHAFSYSDPEILKKTNMIARKMLKKY